MKLKNDIGNRPIKEVLDDHPMIGKILNKHEIGCIKCSIGTCLLKEVVSVHFLGDEVEKQIETEINAHLEQL